MRRDASPSCQCIRSPRSKVLGCTPPWEHRFQRHKGVRDALDIQQSQGKLVAAEDDFQVMVVAGDGSSADIGSGSDLRSDSPQPGFYLLSATTMKLTATRDFNFPELSHRTEAGLRPAPVNQGPSWQERRCSKKDLFEIWKSQNPPYIATVSPREPIDLSNKVCKSQNLERSAGCSSACRRALPAGDSIPKKLM